jgi:Holliday junction DNA helicase RuvA
MYIYIKGILIAKSQDSVILENSGIGYQLNIGTFTYNSLPEINQEVKLNTYHYVREDKEELYGFSTEGEKALFEILIGISSIGPSKAINILSQISPQQFINSVRREDIGTIASIKGIGRKTAERMVLDLRDKISGISMPVEEGEIDQSTYDDALGGLIGLGFKESQAREMLFLIRKEIKATDRAEDIIKKALKKNG